VLFSLLALPWLFVAAVTILPPKGKTELVRVRVQIRSARVCVHVCVSGRGKSLQTATRRAGPSPPSAPLLLSLPPRPCR